MAPSKLRKAIGAMKDQTSISLAKVGNSTCLSDLEVAIVKATRHEEHPPEERHIREILSLTVYSHTFISVCVDTIARRLNKTKNWIVALKSVMLIHRLLLEGDPAYEQEIFFSTRRGTRLLNLSDFRDTSRSDSWDHSAFVRMYALYLDEQLEFKMQGRRGKHSTFAYEEEERVREEEDREEEDVGPSPRTKSQKITPVREMKNELVFTRIQHLLRLLERFLACRPTGGAKHDRIVSVALYLIVKESFQIYYDITEIMSILIDRFMELNIPDSVKVYELFCRLSKQFDELDALYGWCKAVGIARSSEYPEVDKITQKKLDVMEDFMREKSALAEKRKSFKAYEKKGEPVEELKEPEPEPKPKPEPKPEPEPDMNSIKALPAPEEVHEEIKQDTKKEKDNKANEIGDLLNLGEDAPTMEEQANRFALALFDAGNSTASAPPSGMSAWEAFSDTTDWETALVQSASHLSNQKASLPGGFDSLLLDGMYQQGAMNAATASSGLIATGSDSSVALGSAGRPAMLALPAPEGGAITVASGGGDPFAASLAVAPPAYVQMAEMESKQRLLVQEQQLWQQYGRDGMQGHLGLTKLQQNPYPYNTPGYTQSY